MVFPNKSRFSQFSQYSDRPCHPSDRNKLCILRAVLGPLWPLPPGALAPVLAAALVPGGGALGSRMKGAFGIDDFGVVPLKTCAGVEWGREQAVKASMGKSVRSGPGSLEFIQFRWIGWVRGLSKQLVTAVKASYALPCFAPCLWHARRARARLRLTWPSRPGRCLPSQPSQPSQFPSRHASSVVSPEHATNYCTKRCCTWHHFAPENPNPFATRN